MVLPPAYSYASISTVIRVLLMIGFPLSIPGLVVIKGCSICQLLSNAQIYPDLFSNSLVILVRSCKTPFEEAGQQVPKRYQAQAVHLISTAFEAYSKIGRASCRERV